MKGKTGPTARLIEERFWEKVNKDSENGCWIWAAGKYHSGYGIFYVKNGNWKNVRAHRFAYELLVAPIPANKELDHLCRNHACVNPAHLEVVSHKENCQRGENGLKFAELQRQKTHCPHGHPYDLLNTYFKPNGARGCKTCRREWIRNYRLQH